MKHALLTRGVPAAAALGAVATLIALSRGRFHELPEQIRHMRPMRAKERFRLGRFALVELS